MSAAAQRILRQQRRTAQALRNLRATMLLWCVTHVGTKYVLSLSRTLWQIVTPAMRDVPMSGNDGDAMDIEQVEPQGASYTYLIVPCAFGLIFPQLIRVRRLFPLARTCHHRHRRSRAQNPTLQAMCSTTGHTSLENIS